MPALDPGIIHAALARQQTDLTPISRVLSAAAVFPPQLDADDWRGEASAAAEHLESRLRSRLLAADGALEAAVRSTRSALAELGG